MTALPPQIADVLEHGEFCYVAATTERGPHLTPMVFALSGGGVWVTTSRGSVKARAWRAAPTVAGLVRDGDAAVTFGGRVRTYDLLDAETWPRSVARSPGLALASVRFVRKNARFFAGYAVDARHVPFAWTPPGRVFVEIEIERAALVSAGAVRECVGFEADEVPASRGGYRATDIPDALQALPRHLRRALGEDGLGALALGGREGPVVVPARWRSGDGAISAVAPVEVLGLAGAAERTPAALVIDQPSWWRARRMLGCMIQASADVYVPSRVRSGRTALGSAIARAGGQAERDALVRLWPGRVVWWEGWTSGSVMVA